MALAGAGSFRTVTPSRHLATNAWVMRQFMEVEVRSVEHPDETVTVELGG